MKFSSTALTALVLALFVSTSADAALIAGWDFNDDENLDANSGIQSGTATLTTTDSLAGILGLGGGGDALRISGLKLTPTAFTLSLSGTGLTDFVLNYDASSEPLLSIWPVPDVSTSYTQSWSWSVNGDDFYTTGISQPGAITSDGYDPYTVNFSGITGLNDAPQIFLRNSLPGLISGVGVTEVHFDNISVNAVSAVPEPSGVAAMFLGVILIGFFAKKQLSVRRQAATERDAA